MLIPEVRFRRWSSYLRGAGRAFGPTVDLRRCLALLGRGIGRKRKNLYLPSQWHTGRDPIAELLARADDRLEIGLAALLIARDSSPGVDIKEELGRLEAWSRGLRRRFDELPRQQARDPRALIAAVNDALFVDKGMRASDERDPDSLLANLMLPEVMKRRVGHCLGLSVLYLALCHRVGLPVYGVAAPGHFFCRYDDGNQRINIETTLRGAERPDSYYMERYRLSEEAVERQLYLVPVDTRSALIEVLNNRANYYWRRGLQDEAARDLYHATKANRDFARGHTGKGFMALCRGDIEVAIQELETAAKLDPWSPRAALLLGEAQLEGGRHERASITLKRAVMLSPQSAPARSLHARALSKRLRIPQARRAHEAALRLDPQSALAWNNYGVFLAERNDIEGAVNSFVQALENASDFPAAGENLARMKARGWLESCPWLAGEIIDIYQQKIRARPDDRSSALCLARFLIELGEPRDRVRPLAEKAHFIREDAASCEILARLALHDQEWARARRLARKGLSYFPGARSRRRLERIILRVNRALDILYG